MVSWSGANMKPKSKRESIWKMELDELKYVCHTRQIRKYIKRQLSKARRHAEKPAIPEGPS